MNCLFCEADCSNAGVIDGDCGCDIDWDGTVVEDNEAEGYDEEEE